MKRAVAFFAAAVGILVAALVLTKGTSILATGVVAVVAGLAFAAWPEAGMSVIGFVVCIPIVIVQGIVGIPSMILWLAVCAAAVFVPPAGGFMAFVMVRNLWGDGAAVLFLIGFLTLWLAWRRAYRTLIRRTSTVMTDLIKPFNEPIEEFRKKAFAWFEDAGRWMTQ